MIYEQDGIALPETNSKSPENWLSFWEGLFLVAMLASEKVSSQSKKVGGFSSR